MAAAAHRLKLVVDPKIQRVLYAVASGAAIEFLHSVLASPHVSLPFDAATGSASIGNVYDGVEKLRAYAAAEAESRRRCPCPLHGESSREPQQEQEGEERFFVCGGGGGSCGGYVADRSGARCPSCGGEMAVEVPRGCPGASCSAAAAAGAGGVKGAGAGISVACMVMDDLSVMPAGAGLSLASNLMMAFVTPGTVQETVVSIGYTEAIEILETSTTTQTIFRGVGKRFSETGTKIAASVKRLASRRDMDRLG